MGAAAAAALGKLNARGHGGVGVNHGWLEGKTAFRDWELREDACLEVI